MARLEVEVLSKKIIKPSNQTPNHLQNLKLSLFDQLAPRLYPGILYYYSGAGIGRDGNAVTAEKCVDRLEKSLSRALDYLYPFAGRFIKDQVSIDCSDQGAEFWRGRVSCNLSEFLRRRGPEIELADKLLPWGENNIPPSPDSATSPQLAIQVNTFDDGGVVVGVRISHLLADAATTSLFMSTWAAACRGTGGTAVSNFNHDVANAFPAVITPSTTSPGLTHPLLSNTRPGNEANDNNTNNKIVTRRLLISSRLLTRCIEDIKDTHSVAGGGERKPPSRVVMALALVWKALMGASVSKDGFLRDSVLSIPMNLRGKVCLGGKNKGPRKDIFGNFYISVVVPFVGNKTAYDDVGLHDLVGLIKNVIADTSGKVGGASRDELVKMVMDSRREVVGKWNLGGNDDGVDVYFCSSWYGALPVYETDFGWGKPTRAGICTQPGPGVCLMDSCGDDGDGMELWVSLKQAEMLHFKRHFHVLASISSL